MKGSSGFSCTAFHGIAPIFFRGGTSFMMQTTVVVIGGGATGTGILRDLSLRGIDALLVEQRDLAHGTSSRFHGLLHSGGRYAVKDMESAKECIAENNILRKIARYCVEETEGYFVRLPEDDEVFERQWVKSCRQAGIEAVPVSREEALRKEPNLSPRIQSVYKVPDSAIDGFRLVWQNAASARRYGGRILTYTEVTGIDCTGGKVAGITARNVLTGETIKIGCQFIVNAAGSWVGKIAEMAGISVNVKPDRGTLLAFNHRFTGRVINRLHPPSDGDIFVPHGSITILGTTSSAADRPDDTTPRKKEVQALLAIGKNMFENLDRYRILRAFAGTRPLYSADPEAAGRAASRNFAIIDHAKDGIGGMASIAGGKLTTYRLMAEKMVDFVCARLNLTARCRTAEEPLMEEPSSGTKEIVRRYFPAYGADLAMARLGSKGAGEVAGMIRRDPSQKQLVCECELVTMAEVKYIASDSMTSSLSDIRRRTRMGMGTCQGSFCGFRGVGVAVSNGLDWGKDAQTLLREFLETRWKGIRPVLWGSQIREAELMRGIYQGTLNIDGEGDYERT